MCLRLCAGLVLDAPSATVAAAAWLPAMPAGVLRFAASCVGEDSGVTTAASEACFLVLNPAYSAGQGRAGQQAVHEGEWPATAHLSQHGSCCCSSTANTATEELAALCNATPVDLLVYRYKGCQVLDSRHGEEHAAAALSQAAADCYAVTPSEIPHIID
jgi:hypothetical protein